MIAVDNHTVVTTAFVYVGETPQLLVIVPIYWVLRQRSTKGYSALHFATTVMMAVGRKEINSPEIRALDLFVRHHTRRKE